VKDIIKKVVFLFFTILSLLPAYVAGYGLSKVNEMYKAGEIVSIDKDGVFILGAIVISVIISYLTYRKRDRKFTAISLLLIIGAAIGYGVALSDTQMADLLYVYIILACIILLAVVHLIIRSKLSNTVNRSIYTSLVLLVIANVYIANIYQAPLNEITTIKEMQTIGSTLWVNEETRMLTEQNKFISLEEVVGESVDKAEIVNHSADWTWLNLKIVTSGKIRLILYNTILKRHFEEASIWKGSNLSSGLLLNRESFHTDDKGLDYLYYVSYPNNKKVEEKFYLLDLLNQNERLALISANTKNTNLGKIFYIQGNELYTAVPSNIKVHKKILTEWSQCNNVSIYNRSRDWEWLILMCYTEEIPESGRVYSNLEYFIYNTKLMHKFTVDNSDLLTVPDLRSNHVLRQDINDGPYFLYHNRDKGNVTLRRFILNTLKKQI